MGDDMKELERVYKTIGQRIREIRKQKNLTLEALSFNIGMNYSFLARIETGKAAATIESFVRIAKGLDVDFFTLFNNVEVRNNKIIEKDFKKLTDKLSVEEKAKFISVLKLILYK